MNSFSTPKCMVKQRSRSSPCFSDESPGSGMGRAKYQNVADMWKRRATQQLSASQTKQMEETLLSSIGNATSPALHRLSAISPTSQRVSAPMVSPSLEASSLSGPTSVSQVCIGTPSPHPLRGIRSGLPSPFLCRQTPWTLVHTPASEDPISISAFESLTRVSQAESLAIGSHMEEPGQIELDPGQSKMEFALELVNHVPPAVADALVGRLRQAESAQELAKSRTARARKRRDFLESIAPRQSRFWFALFVLMTTSLFASLSQIDTQESGSLNLAVTDPELSCDEKLCGSMLAEMRCAEGKLQEAKREAECGLKLTMLFQNEWVSFIREFASGSVEESCEKAMSPAFQLLHDLHDSLRRRGAQVEADVAWITRTHSEVFNRTRS